MQGVALKKPLTPKTKKQAVTYAVTGLGRSRSKTCLLVGMARASYDYRLVAADRDEKLRELAHQRRIFDCPRIHFLVQREGLVINHKRTERMCREEGLSLGKRKHKKTPAMSLVIPPVPAEPDERWSVNFRTDSLVTGRRFRALAIVDDYSGIGRPSKYTLP